MLHESRSGVEVLEQHLGANWSNIRAARERTESKRRELRKALVGFDSEDTSIVVFGSLARGEFTDESDIDWTLLVDGSADPQHLALTLRVETVMQDAAKKEPGREKTFGSMAFSHEIIHQIGGQDDTNRNTTRRILLLLESDTVGREEAYERVFRTTLQRYLTEDRKFILGQAQHRVPRFLLNDFARYWRTLCVDFAYKQRTRSGQGLALRNIKLRMSRKLIYVSGLLACFSCQLGFGLGGGVENCAKASGSLECVECLREFLRQTPLETLANTLYEFKLDATAKRLFNAYDEFVGMLSDTPTRKHLEDLPMDFDENDPVFQRARKLSHEFRDGLLDLFFNDHKELSNLTRIYGVF